MKHVEKYLWRIQWAGRPTTTRVHFTEEEIRAQHPEAVRIDSSRMLVELPEAPAELDPAMRPRGQRSPNRLSCTIDGMKEQFRLDINGLRALAVLAVLLFHFGVPGFAGGFVGVDVFFVISGYLMTRIIADGIEVGSFSVARFYLARAKRIVPALAALCAFVMAFGYLRVPPAEYSQMSKHVAASLAFVSNVVYWREAGYFAAESHEKWLLHTWSLSVEWQFYLLYPLVLLGLYRMLPRQRVRIVVLVVVALSFAFNVLWTVRSADAAFFLLPTRAWELLFGAVVYYFPSRKLRPAMLEYGGLLLILGSALLLTDAGWPGWRAAIPAAGAAFIIMANRGRATALRFAPVQWLGKVSYSTYLWHWPIVVWLAQTDRLVSPAWQILGTVSALAAGALSYWFIESNALRKSAASMRLQYAGVLAVALPAAVAAAAVIGAGGLGARMPEAYHRVAQDMQLPRRDNGWCFYSVDSLKALKVGADGLGCSIGAPHGPTRALLFGDSFAGQYEPFWDEIGRRDEVRIAAVSTNWCTPSFGTEYFGPNTRMRSYAQCIENRRFLKQASAQYPVVIFAGYWRALFDAKQEASLYNAIDRVARTARLVVVMAAPTSFDVNIESRWEAKALAREPFDPATYGKSRDELTSRANQQIAAFATRYQNVVFLDRQALFESSDLTRDSIPFGLEGTHLSIYGSRAAAQAFKASTAYRRVSDALRTPPVPGSGAAGYSMRSAPPS